jgi:hypothetical protein
MNRREVLKGATAIAAVLAVPAATIPKECNLDDNCIASFNKSTWAGFKWTDGDFSKVNDDIAVYGSAFMRISEPDTIVYVPFSDVHI